MIPRRAVPPALRALLLVLASALLAAPAQASLPTLADLSRAGDELHARPATLAADLPRELPTELPKECNGPFCVEPLETRVRGFDLRLSCQVGGEAGVTCTARPAWGFAYGGRAAERSVFTGHVFEQETGLYYAKARFLDPKLGRFISQDSFLGKQDDPPSLHRYLYANDNPARFIDPTGHAAKDEQISARAPSTASLVRGGIAYGVETAAEFFSPMPLGLSDPDTSFHPLAGNTASSSWLTGDNQIAEDYAAFQERYGGGARVVEAGATAKFGGKIGKAVSAAVVVSVIVGQKRSSPNGVKTEDGVAPLPSEKKTLRPGETTEYQKFKGRSVIGDELEGHEGVQHSQLKQEGLAGERRLSTEASRKNPVLVLDAETHGEVSKEQLRRGTAKMPPPKSIKENMQILRDLEAATKKQIDTFARRTMEFAKEWGLLKKKH